MNILWLKDKKIGHEKQVKALLDELSKSREINIIESEVDYTFDDKLNDIFFGWFERLIKKSLHTTQDHHIWNIHKKYKRSKIDIIIGAGHNTYPYILSYKNALTLKRKSLTSSSKGFINKIIGSSSNYERDKDSDLKAIAVLTPSLNQVDFDLICAPNHDAHRLKYVDDTKKIFYEGSLSKVYDNQPDDNIGFIGLGGKNKHYKFDVDNIFKQIQYVTSIYPTKNWYIFNSRRTPKTLNELIETYVIENKIENIFFQNSNNKEIKSYDEIISVSSIKIVTQDSVNMIYESLSSRGETILFNMNYFKNNKIVKQIHNLLRNKQVGYIDDGDLTKDLKAMKIIRQQNKDLFAEVEKLAFKINQFIEK
tara:strand:- start:187 stop:1281 length:1095 start_codon:yes stop_codon:yes gene_type:complete